MTNEMDQDAMNPLEEFFEQFGVLGMKWGVRRADAKFEKKADSHALMVRVYNKAARDFNAKDVDRINNKPKYRNADLTRPSKLRDQYYRETNDALIHRLQEAADAEGTNRSGTRKYRIIEHDDDTWSIVTEDVKHAEELDPLRFKLDLDGKGFITSITLLDGSMEQDAMDPTQTYLEQFGVKGMRWGVRKAKENFGVTADSKAVKKLHGRTKKGGTDTLTNEELEKAIKRMDLEQKYRKVKGNDSWKKKGLQLAGQILKEFGMAYISSFVKHPTANAASGGTYAWAYAGAKTIDSVVVNRRELEN